MDFTLFNGLIDFKPTGIPQVDQAVSHIQSSLQNLGKQFSGLNFSHMFSGLGEHLTQVLSIGKAVGLDVSAGLTSAFTAIAPELSETLAVPIVGEIAMGLAAAARLVMAGMGREREHSRFDTLTGGHDATDKLFGTIKKNFTGTDVNVEQMKDLSKEMLAAGMSVDAINGRLKALGNVSLATGASVGGMHKALERMEMTGRITNRTLMAFGLGFEMEMAKARGITMETLREQISSGKLTAADVQNEVQRQGGAGGKGDKIRIAELNDVIGQLGRMYETITEPFKKLGEFLIHTLHLGGALGVVNSILGVFGSAIQGVISALAPIGNLIGAVLEPIWDSISLVFKSVGGVLELFGQAIGWLLTPLADFGKWFTDWYNEHIGLKSERDIESFSPEEIAQAKKDEDRIPNKVFGGPIYDDNSSYARYWGALHKRLGQSNLDLPFDRRSIEELEQAIATKQVEPQKTDDNTQGGHFINLSELNAKIQEAALKQNLATS